MLPDELTDGCVLLRPWTVADAAWYASCAQDAEVQRFTTDPPSLTADEVAAAIGALPEHPDRVAYLIADAGTGESMGNLALDRSGAVAEVSYWVAAAARGRGAAARAVRLVTTQALARLPIAEVRLWTHADNAASRTVAERAGFVRDGRADRVREVKGEQWPTVAYVRRRSGLDDEYATAHAEWEESGEADVWGSTAGDGLADRP